ncbi:MAG: signal peptidase I [Flavobacteriales bacterium]
MKKIMLKQLREWTLALFIAVLIAGMIRIFILQGFFIPSQSMEPTLQAGDFIFISKYHYGARIPMTPIAMPFMHQTLPFSKSRKAYWDGITLPYFRLPGFTEIKRNDVLVFNYPMENERPVDKRSYYVKRCVGLPGELIEVVAKRIRINDSLMHEKAQIQINRKLRSSKELDPAWMDSLGITEGGKLSNLNDYLFPLTDTLTEQLRKTNYIFDVQPLISKKGDFHAHVFPNEEILPYNADFFGPVLIPFKGMKVKLNDTTVALYRRIIETYEKHDLKWAGKQASIDGNLTDEYTFEMDYYFVLGDNRDQSADSRFWGFVPENHIVGKALFVGFSYNKFSPNGLKIRWNRIFSRIE